MNRVITMLKTNQLYHHPNNPRAVYDKLDELAASIRMNGVWQNLTVVPFSPVDHSSLTPADPDNAYVVVMGNRRLEASYLAEQEELPCVISDMPLSAQIMAMVQENNLREAADPYKEAQNYQMLLDMGETVDTLAEKSGLSTTTIRNRVSLLVLNKEKFAAAQERGARMTDYLELNKVKDPVLKNKVLDTIGTKNFTRTLENAIHTEKRRDFMQESLALVSTFATQIDNEEAIPGIRHLATYAWYKADKASVPAQEDLDAYLHYFVKKGDGEEMELRVYTTKPAPEIVIDQAQIQKKEAEEKRKAQIKALNASTYAMRFSFVKDRISNTKAKKNLGDIAKFVAAASRQRDDATVYYEQAPWRIEYKAVAELLDIPYDETNGIDEQAFSNALLTRPEYALFCIAYTQFDKKGKSYIADQWNSAKQIYETVYQANDALDKLYFVLEKLGYEISDEELALMNGNHDIFTDEDEPAQAETPEQEPVAETPAVTAAA